VIRPSRVTMFAACVAFLAAAGTAVAQQVPPSLYRQMRWRM